MSVNSVTNKTKELEEKMNALSAKLYHLQKQENKLDEQLEYNKKQQEKLTIQYNIVFDKWRTLIENNNHVEGD